MDSSTGPNDPGRPPNTTHYRRMTALEEERERRSMAEGTMRRNLAAAAQTREESPAPVPPTEGEGPAEETIIGAIEGEGA